ncbi:type VI secretion system amidase effector protein Tae4 [Bartonella sp. HY038]|uniref:type VI secretion system amidase effector protein Tae4 n=1 Tax=Bartonella sp. HY038 TaxID=2759660 RepID=UPI0015FE52A8|nr:type VI secretion system amidase effector protein Tae4 [Bartonella sp. HY038]
MAQDVNMEVISFKTLWDNYPSESKPCPGDFSNQCAIRVSHALLDSGVDFSSCPAVKCYGPAHNYLGKHVLRAEELAVWLNTMPVKGMKERVKLNPENFHNEIDGKTGIIFFKDYYTVGNQQWENRSGDHIDLWNKNKTTGYLFRWSRAMWETLAPDVSAWSKCREVWFWELK